MTDTDSTKVIEKLTEVLDLLKSAKKKETKPVEETKPSFETKPPSETQCPLRKAMSEKEFADIVERMKKADVVKLYRNFNDCKDCKDCAGCPFMNKNVPEEFEEEKKTLEEAEKRTLEGVEACQKADCFQLINIILTVILFILFFVFLIRALKGLYCTV